MSGISAVKPSIQLPTLLRSSSEDCDSLESFLKDAPTSPKPRSDSDKENQAPLIDTKTRAPSFFSGIFTAKNPVQDSLKPLVKLLKESIAQTSKIKDAKERDIQLQKIYLRTVSEPILVQDKIQLLQTLAKKFTDKRKIPAFIYKNFANHTQWEEGFEKTLKTSFQDAGVKDFKKDGQHSHQFLRDAECIPFVIAGKAQEKQDVLTALDTLCKQVAKESKADATTFIKHASQVAAQNLPIAVGVSLVQSGYIQQGKEGSLSSWSSEKNFHLQIEASKDGKSLIIKAFIKENPKCFSPLQDAFCDPLPIDHTKSTLAYSCTVKLTPSENSSPQITVSNVELSELTLIPL